MTQSRNCGGFVWAENPEEFLKIARDRGWQEALRNVQKKDSPDKLREALAPNRLGWFNLIDVKPSMRALDIGAGTGGIACQLAKKCFVTAVDGSEIDVEFLKIRAQQEKLSQLSVLVANAVSLPFENNYFDIVIMNGVLEWVATAERTDVPPMNQQIKALEEARRVLKPHGKFLLGIENRYFWGYFLGIPEPHLNMKYISLLERSDAEQLSRNIRNLPFREYTYSRQEYEKLIKEAGFEQVETYWLYPDYRLPQYIIPLGNVNAVKYFVNELLKPQNPDNNILYSIYQFYKFCDPKVICDFVGHYGFVCY